MWLQRVSGPTNERGAPLLFALTRAQRAPSPRAPLTDQKTFKLFCFGASQTWLYIYASRSKMKHNNPINFYLPIGF